MSGGVRKNVQMTTFTMPNNVSSMNYALKSVPGLADVGVPHGDEDGPITLAPGSGSKIPGYCRTPGDLPYQPHPLDPTSKGPLLILAVPIRLLIKDKFMKLASW